MALGIGIIVTVIALLTAQGIGTLLRRSKVARMKRRVEEVYCPAPVRPAPCDLCNRAERVLTLANGGRICEACRDTLATTTFQG